jgi:hypothetical protein
VRSYATSGRRRQAKCSVLSLSYLDNFMNKHLRYLALATVAKIGETSQDIVARIAQRCNVRVLDRRGERFIDTEDLPVLLAVISAGEPALALQDGDQ